MTLLDSWVGEFSVSLVGEMVFDRRANSVKKKKEILARAGLHKNQMLNVGDFNTVRSRRVRGTIQCQSKLGLIQLN